jgi:hypothetical protein
MREVRDEDKADLLTYFMVADKLRQKGAKLNIEESSTLRQ